MIKRLEMEGFKSFRKKVSIPLSEGFTAIVGPNGSGKSNICDAISFVLGRTSAQTMRAKVLTHLIYNGGNGKPPAKHLEVSLILDNKKRKYPFDTDEVTITRRLTRNGTMTYKLNGERCTLSRLLEFLKSAQLTATGHNIVPQEEITSFIKMDPIERRKIIDDMSGISEYDDKKAKGEKDLKVVEDRIKELVIVMSERKKRVEVLESEKEDAEKYKELEEKKKKLSANLEYTKYKDIQEKQEEIEERLQKKENKSKDVKKELEEIEKKVEQKENELSKLDDKLIKEGGRDQLASKNEVERLQGRISINESKIESKRSEISSLDSMISKMQDMIGEKGMKKSSKLKDNIEGVYGSIGELVRVDPKYSTAIDAALGARKRYIVVDNDDTALKCIKFLRSNKLGRATFLPLNKIKGPKRKPMRGKGVIGLAISLVDYDKKYETAFSYVFGNTYIVEDLKKVKSLIGKFRMVSKDGDIAEKSGAMRGGYTKRKSSKKSEINEQVKRRDKLLDEIEELNLEIEDLKRKLGEEKKRAQKLGADFESLEGKRDNIQEEIKKLRESKEKVKSKHDELQRKVGDIRIEKAKVDSRIVDIKINIDNLKDKDFKKGDIDKMEKSLEHVKQKLHSLEPVNMKAIDLYEEEMKEYSEFKEKFDKLKEERNSVIEFIEEIENKKKDVFYSVFNPVSEYFSELFPRLSPNGSAELVLEDEEDPLSGGLFINASPRGKNVSSMEALSGGEKVITALAFLFALQRFKPAPFYLLDEVDAALDQKNSMRFVELLKESVEEAQLLVISHNHTVVKEADSLFGVSMGPGGVSKVVGMNLSDFESVVGEKENES